MAATQVTCASVDASFYAVKDASACNQPTVDHLNRMLKEYVGPTAPTPQARIPHLRDSITSSMALSSKKG